MSQKETIMKKISLFIVALLAITTTSIAQTKEANALLWKIEGPNGGKPSYLFGTFHMLCDSDLVQLDTAFSYVDQCEQVFLELDMDDPSIGQKMQQNIFMKDGHTLKEYVTDSAYTAMNAQCMKMSGMPLDAMATMKPFMIMTMIYPLALNCPSGAPGSPELSLVQKAMASNKPVGGLETIEYQLAIFDSIPYQTQAEQLQTTLLDFNSFINETNEMLALYRKHNIQGMYTFTLENEMAEDGAGAMLLDHRNNNWIPVIQKATKEKSTFIAVGAAHLGGENGVINLLIKAGYKVTPIL